MGQFIWNGKLSLGKYHLVKWSHIARPIKEGGLRIMDPVAFNSALIIKNMWREVSRSRIWSKIMTEKYMCGQSFTALISIGAKRKTNSSYIWRSMMKNIQWMMGLVWWEVGDGTIIKIGLDAIKGMEGNHSLSYGILNFLHKKEIIYLNQIFMHDVMCIHR